MVVIVMFGAASSLLQAQSPVTESNAVNDYTLGPDDQLAVQVPDLEEIGNASCSVDEYGDIHLPLIGSVHAAGLRTEELRIELVRRLTRFLHEPSVRVSIVEQRSQPVSVLGAVNKPGVYQLQGHKTLVEIISLAGGLREDAGSRITLTRSKTAGSIPLPAAVEEAGCRCSRVELPVRLVMEGKHAAYELALKADDIISIPRCESVYVVGSVRQPGGFPLKDKEALSALQALSLAGGLDRAAAPQHARIIHVLEKGNKHVEEQVDLRKILSGGSRDIGLSANDILFIPNSAQKAAAFRSLEAAIQMATGVVIWRR